MHRYAPFESGHSGLSNDLGSHIDLHVKLSAVTKNSFMPFLEIGIPQVEVTAAE